MIKAPIISIILPVYNTAPKIFEECYMSIVKQSYSNIEIIIIDDGSSKENEEQYLSFIQKGTIYKKQRNQGVSAARNLGLEIAKGDYITFVDSDDKLEKNFINKAVAIILKHKTELLLTGKTIIDNKMIDIWLPNKIVQEKTQEAFAEIMLNNYLYVCAGTIISKKLARESSFDSKLSLGEDTLYFANVYSKAKNIKVSNLSGYQYLKQNSILTKGSGYKRAYEYIKQNNTFLNRLNEILNNSQQVVNVARCVKLYEALSILADKDNSLLGYKALINEAGIVKVDKKILKKTKYRTIRKIIIRMISGKLYLLAYGLLVSKARIKRVQKISEKSNSKE